MKITDLSKPLAPSFLAPALIGGFLAFTPAFASAADTSAPSNANCEIVLMQTIQDESGRGGAQVASYRPADDFLISVYDDGTPPMLTVKKEPIQAVMCKRADVIPTKKDYPIVATGIPFFLSQSFESQDTDLITVFYKDSAFRHEYKGPGLSEEAESLLKDRLAMFDKMKAEAAK